MQERFEFDTLPELSTRDLLQLPAHQTQVLTVNNRHARRLLAEFAATLGEQRRVMAVPDVTPFGAWLVRQADELTFVHAEGVADHTLDSLGAQLLWQHVIECDVAGDGLEPALLDLPQAARLAADADALIDEWHIHVNDLYTTADYQRFLVWRNAYHDALAERSLEDRNQLYNQVCRAFSQQLLRVDFSHVVLAGFNEASPRFADLLAALQQQGVAVFRLATSAEAAAQPLCIAADDPDAEWRLAAQWAAQCMQANPQGRYAIIASRLQTDVALAHRYLQPLGAYNVALGRPLSEWPLIRAALNWLAVLAGLARNEMLFEPERLGVALLAGFCVAHKAEESGRANIDAYWRQRAVLHVSQNDFLSLLDKHAPRLAQSWVEAGSHAKLAGTDAMPHIWSARFRQWLQVLGFPGDASLDSTAYQQLEAFDQILDKLAGQQAVLGPVSARYAATVLRRLCGDTPFQPRRDPNARLDVLGFLEAEGGRWDGVWVLGLTDDMLPATPRPNPFIPVAALRQAGAPRATPERELQWAKTLYASLLCTAAEVRLSYPRFEGERELRPSPCMAGVPIRNASLQNAAAASVRLETLVDEQGPPLSEHEPVKGGIGVIDTQARNPLWAFVRFRLGGRLLPAYAQGSDAGMRGRFVHAVAQSVWNSLQDHEGLHAAFRANQLQPVIEQAALQASDQHLQDYSPTLRTLEQARVVGLMVRWLERELKREPFVVTGTEQNFYWQQGALHLSVCLDRVDRLADGRVIVIDYKTGSAKLNVKPDWVRQRPINLQLPFYASLLAQGGAQVAGLVLAQLNPRELGARGLADGDIGIDGLDQPSDWEPFSGWSWQQVQQHWASAVTRLADEFCRGYAANATERQSDLAYCDVLPFLRLTGEPQRDD